MTRAATRCNVPGCTRIVAHEAAGPSAHGRCPSCRWCELRGLPFHPGRSRHDPVSLYCECRNPTTDVLGMCIDTDERRGCGRITREACERSLGIRREAAA